MITLAAQLVKPRGPFSLHCCRLAWKGAVILAAAALCFGPTVASAAVITLTPSADTMISERYPENNFGAMLIFNSGTTQNSNYNRGLLRFDVANSLPAGAKILSATLTLEVVGEPNEEFPAARFNLHRLLVPWGEGSQTNPPFGGLGVGSPASTNEATWTHRFAFTTNTWSQPGAGAPVDYVSTITSGVTVGGVDQSPYTIPNTAQLVADLQLWVDQPATNFGWALVCQQETTKFTARRFASREDPENAPALEIHYLVAPLLQQFQKAGNALSFTFVAQPEQHYVIESSDALGPAAVWTALAQVAPVELPTSVLVLDLVAAPRRFYRVRTY